MNQVDDHNPDSVIQALEVHIAELEAQIQSVTRENEDLKDFENGAKALIEHLFDTVPQVRTALGFFAEEILKREKKSFRLVGTGSSDKDCEVCGVTGCDGPQTYSHCPKH